MKQERGVIFDLDGTLVDSLEDITNALNTALLQLGYRTIEADQARDWIGDGFTTLCTRVMTHVGAAERAEDLAEVARSTYHVHCVRRTKPYRNILKMLELLSEAGVAMAVLSNKPHDLTVRVVDELDLARFFRIVRGCRDDLLRKPAPDEALDIARQIDIDPRRFVFVGDSVVDIETARNAGMKAVAVGWGFQGIFKLSRAEPDRLIADPLELPALITGGDGRLIR